MKIEEWEVVKGRLLFLSSYLINRTYSRACPQRAVPFFKFWPFRYRICFLVKKPIQMCGDAICMDEPYVLHPWQVKNI